MLNVAIFFNILRPFPSYGLFLSRHFAALMFSGGFKNRICYIFSKHPQGGKIFGCYQHKCRFNICSNFLQHFFLLSQFGPDSILPDQSLIHKDGFRARIIAICRKIS